MSRKRFRAGEIIHKLREVEVLLAQGKKAPEVYKKLGVTEQTYYRWRREYGGLKVEQFTTTHSHSGLVGFGNK